MSVLCSPEKFASIPSRETMRIRPPPMLSATTSSVRPLLPVSWRRAVFGCALRSCMFLKVYESPRSFAASKLCGMRRSSGCIPSSPAISAQSVPCPRPVSAKLPCRDMSACTGSSPSSFRAVSPMRTAPAVWLLDGPTITGPSISNNRMIFLRSAFQCCAPSQPRYAVAATSSSASLGSAATCTQ